MNVATSATGSIVDGWVDSKALSLRPWKDPYDPLVFSNPIGWYSPQASNPDGTAFENVAYSGVLGTALAAESIPSWTGGVFESGAGPMGAYATMAAVPEWAATAFSFEGGSIGSYGFRAEWLPAFASEGFASAGTLVGSFGIPSASWPEFGSGTFLAEVSAPVGSFGAPLSSVPHWSEYQFSRLASQTPASAAPFSGTGGESVLAARDGNGDVLAEAQAPDKDLMDPVDPATGDFLYENAFLRLAGGREPFEFSLSYRSSAGYDGASGHDWIHPFERKILPAADGSAKYSDGEGGTWTFAASGTGYARSEALKAGLSRTGSGGWLLSMRNGRTETFDPDGLLETVADPDGVLFSLSRDRYGNLASVADSLGRVVRFENGQDGRVAKVSDPLGREVRLSYASQTGAAATPGDLVSVSLWYGTGAEKTVSFGYGTGAHDLHKIVSLTDSKGQEYVTNGYGADGRVAWQRYGEGTGFYSYVL